MTIRRFFFSFLLAFATLSLNAQIQTNAGVQYLQNCAKDMSTDFSDLSNTYFLADSLVSFDKSKGEGLVNWKRYRLSPRQAFNLNGYWPVRMQMLDFPDTQYGDDPNRRIKLDFIDDRTVRVRMITTPIVPQDEMQSDPMFSDEFKARWSSISGNNGWTASENATGVTYKNGNGSIEIQKYPWRLIVRDASGKVLTQTRAIIDNDSTQVKLLPFCFI